MKSMNGNLVWKKYIESPEIKRPVKKVVKSTRKKEVAQLTIHTIYLLILYEKANLQST